MLFTLGCNPINSDPEEYIDLSSASPPVTSVVVEVSPTPTTEVAPPEVVHVAPVDERPEVRVYTTENCPPCLRLKHEIAGLSNEESAELPVRFRQVAEVPEWVTGFPTLHWETADGWVSTEGWNGLDKFLETYRKPVSSSKKKDGTTSLSGRSIENNSSILFSESKPKSGDTVAVMPSSPWGGEQGSLSRRKRH